jgi:RNA-directed DNA polymerase
VLDRVRLRLADKRVLALIKAFLKAGVMSADGMVRDSTSGTPQGGIVTPPTQLATSVSRSPWVIGGWSG